MSSVDPTNRGTGMPAPKPITADVRDLENSAEEIGKLNKNNTQSEPTDLNTRTTVSAKHGTFYKSVTHPGLE